MTALFNNRERLAIADTPRKALGTQQVIYEVPIDRVAKRVFWFSTSMRCHYQSSCICMPQSEQMSVTWPMIAPLLFPVHPCSPAHSHPRPACGFPGWKPLFNTCRQCLPLLLRPLITSIYPRQLLLMAKCPGHPQGISPSSVLWRCYAGAIARLQMHPLSRFALQGRLMCLGVRQAIPQLQGPLLPLSRSSSLRACASRLPASHCGPFLLLCGRAGAVALRPLACPAAYRAHHATLLCSLTRRLCVASCTSDTASGVELATHKAKHRAVFGIGDSEPASVPSAKHGMRHTEHKLLQSLA